MATRRQTPRHKLSKVCNRGPTIAGSSNLLESEGSKQENFIVAPGDCKDNQW